jgi:hypothetical protein
MKRRSFFSQLAIAVTSAVFASSVDVFGAGPEIRLIHGREIDLLLINSQHEINNALWKATAIPSSYWGHIDSEPWPKSANRTLKSNYL